MRVTTLRAANLRDGPEAGARVLRVLSPATSRVVFSRQGSCVEIGENSAAGWFHNSLLQPSR